MKLSARNILKGMVVQIKADEVNSEVILELPGGAQIVSVITINILSTSLNFRLCLLTGLYH